jgi:hypothetical protein
MFMMWQANLSSTFRSMKVLNSLLNTFMKKIIGLRQYHNCAMLNLGCAEPSNIHIHNSTVNLKELVLSA